MIKEKLLKEITEFLKKKWNINLKINFSTRFTELNLDSIDLINLLFEFEKKYQIKINDTRKISSIETMGDFINLVIEILNKNEKKN